VSDRLTISVIVGTRTDAHSFRSQVGMGLESDCLFGQLGRILCISDSEAGVKVEKTGGVAEGEGRCGEVMVGLLARDRRSLDILSVKKEAKRVYKESIISAELNTCSFIRENVVFHRCPNAVFAALV